MASMQAADAGEIDAALLMGGNLYASQPGFGVGGAGAGEDRLQAVSDDDAELGHVRGVSEGESLILPVTRAG